MKSNSRVKLLCAKSTKCSAGMSWCSAWVKTTTIQNNKHILGLQEFEKSKFPVCCSFYVKLYTSLALFFSSGVLRSEFRMFEFFWSSEWVLGSWTISLFIFGSVCEAFLHSVYFEITFCCFQIMTQIISTQDFRKFISQKDLGQLLIGDGLISKKWPFLATVLTSDTFCPFHHL